MLKLLCMGIVGRDSNTFKYVAEVISEGGMPYLETDTTICAIVKGMVTMAAVSRQADKI